MSSPDEEVEDAPRPFLNEDWGATLLGIALVLAVVFGVIAKGVWQ